MNTDDSSRGSDSTSNSSQNSPLSGVITVGLLSWAVLSIGFYGLKILMQERPEFVGQPLRVTKAELIQESPRIVVRKINDDISLIKNAQLESSDVRFDMTGRRDYRGLRTIRDMSGEFRARYVISNAFEEPIFVLFKCPHPRTENGETQSLLAGELRLQSSTSGIQENSKDAWFWSGTIEQHQSTDIDVSYRVASLKGISYRVTPQDGNQVKKIRVAMQRHDLASMRFESGDGTRNSTDDSIVWERKDFLAPDFFSADIAESRNLFASFSRLLEIGPLISLLFLVAVSAVILARQKLTPVQVLTIAAGYGLYFPLILYLSANFSFVWALLIAVMVPGILLVNYARWLLGGRIGLIGGVLFLGLYQIFPTLAALAGWNRGMVLLCLGIVTLAVLINLQNRALKQKAQLVAALITVFLFPSNVSFGQLQVVLPAELAGKLVDPGRKGTNSQVSFEPVQYKVQQELTHFRIEAQVAFQVLQAGESVVPLFAGPVYLQSSRIESAESAGLITFTNRIGLFAHRAGPGSLKLVYRAPIETREGKSRVQIPLVLGPSGNLRLESSRNNIETLTGTLWTRTAQDKTTAYDIGVAGEESLILEWRDQGNGSVVPGGRNDGTKEFYGIGLTRAQNLTIINSDGSCTHFAEFELPVSQSDEFRLRLPPKARLISVSVNGTEMNSPVVDNQVCRVRLPPRDAQQTSHQLSFRMAFPSVRLGFMGMAELMLPEFFQTVGTLEWVVALPNGFETQLISSGLEKQKAVPDLARFGDYGRILKSHAHTYLAKDLAPPGAMNLSLKYRQIIPGMSDLRAE